MLVYILHIISWFLIFRVGIKYAKWIHHKNFNIYVTSPMELRSMFTTVKTTVFVLYCKKCELYVFTCTSVLLLAGCISLVRDVCKQTVIFLP